MSTITVTLDSAPNGKAAVSGTLRMNGNAYQIITGGHGKGALPLGTYEVRKRHVTEGAHLDAGFRAGGVAFFIPLNPPDTTDRSGFGIHPDGNVTGTLGCIGLYATDARRFWKDWLNMSLSSRPELMTVST